MRIRNDIKFLYIKKRNKFLYSLHIDNANKCKNTWNIIFQSIAEELEENRKTTYKKFNKKIQTLMDKHTDYNKNTKQQTPSTNAWRI
jgi:hypothetical protein